MSTMRYYSRIILLIQTVRQLCLEIQITANANNEELMTFLWSGVCMEL